VEILLNCSNDLLTFRRYNIKVEKINAKARVSTYINSTISCNRREDMESMNKNLVIIDVHGTRTVIIINIYRSIKPKKQCKPKSLISSTIIKNLMTKNTILLCDFNLDD
jgi:undecaprenyl pyrophosphate synthase